MALPKHMWSPGAQTAHNYNKFGAKKLSAKKQLTIGALQTEFEGHAQVLKLYAEALPKPVLPLAASLLERYSIWATAGGCMSGLNFPLSPKQQMWVRMLAERALTCDDLPRFKKVAGGATLMLCFGCAGECDDEATKGVCKACQRKYGKPAAQACESADGGVSGTAPAGGYEESAQSD